MCLYRERSSRRCGWLLLSALFAVACEPTRLFADLHPEILQHLTTVPRWLQTSVQSSGLSQGTPTRLSWSIVPDQTLIVPSDGTGQTQASDLRSFFDQVFGERSEWQPLVEDVFTRWGSVSGLSYVYEPNDDGQPIRPNDPIPGVVGIRGDIRLGGVNLDNGGPIAGYGYFPDHGDIVLDTSETWITSSDSGRLLLQNLIAHEHGHGLGLGHVDSPDATILMEPFLTSGFSGPQLDDILVIQRAYGDPLEKNGGNDSQFTATRLGTIEPGSSRTMGADAASLDVRFSATDFVSIDGSTDVDYFQFEVPGRSTATIRLTPQGPSYQVMTADGPQTVNTSALNDLTLQVLSAGSFGAIATANQNGVGGEEAIVDLLLPEAGVYSLRVTGELDLPQFYELSVTVHGEGTVRGDTDGDGQLTAADIDQFSRWLQNGTASPDFDLNGDQAFTWADRDLLVNESLRVYYGDADLNGLFESADLVQVFMLGEYEDQLAQNSGWESGDWDGDLEFGTSDLVLAFQQAGYEQGPRVAVWAVPEPTSCWPLLLASGLPAWLRTKSRKKARVRRT